MQPTVHRRVPSPHHRTTQPRMSTTSRWRKPGARKSGSRMHLLVCPSPVSGFLSLGRLTKEGSQRPRRPWGGGRRAPSFASTHSARADARTAYSGAGLRDFMLPGVSILGRPRRLGFAVEHFSCFPASTGKSLHLSEPHFPHLQNGCRAVKCANGYKALRAQDEADGGWSLPGFQPPCSQRGYRGGWGCLTQAAPPPSSLSPHRRPPRPAEHLRDPVVCVSQQHLASTRPPVAHTQENRPLFKVLDPGKALGKYS